MTNLNMYQRLRDFNVPASVLDEIFSKKDDLNILSESWNAIEAQGLNGDEIAEEVSKIIFDELGDDIVHSSPNMDEK
ncbi:hypothetical protein JYT44_02195 [Caldithrix abyssi]|nr:hypothetical protein [Caldithrix abyssi]